MNTFSVPLRRRALAYAAQAILLIILGWTLWGHYMAFKWLKWYHFNEQSLAPWLLLVAGVVYLASWGFFLWFFTWLGKVVSSHTLNR